MLEAVCFDTRTRITCWTRAFNARRNEAVRCVSTAEESRTYSVLVGRRVERSYRRMSQTRDGNFWWSISFHSRECDPIDLVFPCHLTSNEINPSGNKDRLDSFRLDGKELEFVRNHLRERLFLQFTDPFRCSYWYAGPRERLVAIIELLARYYWWHWRENHFSVRRDSF